MVGQVLAFVAPGQPVPEAFTEANQHRYIGRELNKANEWRTSR